MEFGQSLAFVSFFSSLIVTSAACTNASSLIGEIKLGVLFSGNLLVELLAQEDEKFRARNIAAMKNLLLVD